jgi:PAS domain S-box-containing protein
MEAQPEHSAAEIERLRRRVEDLGSLLGQRTAELAAADEALKQEADGRRRAEAALRLRALDFQLIVDSIPVPVAVTTPSGEVEGLNRLTLAYFGKKLEELKGWTASDVVHPDDLQRTVDAQLEAHRRGDAYDVESRHRRADGIYRWFNVRGFPLRDAQGRILRWFHLLIDIDDWRRAEEALRASERNLTQIINTIPTTAWSTRPDGYCDFLNQRWLAYAGFSAEQAQGWGWGAAIHPDDLNGLVAYWQTCLAAGTPVEAEARMRRFDGEYRWFLFRANPLRDESGAVVKWYGTNIDIDDRKRAEQALRRSEAFLAEGQRLSLTGTFSWRVDTDEIMFSGELHRIFEFDQDAAVTLELIAARVHPEDIPLLAEKIAHARAGGSDLEYEIRLRMPDGSVRYLRTIARGTRHPDGRLEYVGAIQDVTQRRLADEALAETRSELAHVARVTSLGLLTASIAHEVKQPLAAIITNGETSLRWLDRAEPDVEEIRKLTQRMVADSRRASEIIDRIRDMAARRAPEQTLVSLDDVVKESMVFLREELQTRKVAVALELAAALPRVVGDRTQLQQVVVNLAINAAQAMAQAGAARRSILIRTMLADAETVCCTVEDSGPGIEPENIPRLFDTFFTTKDGGMGMGLPISRSIIEALGGRISADNGSALGGARFSVALPGHLAAVPAHR